MKTSSINPSKTQVEITEITEERHARRVAKVAGDEQLIKLCEQIHNSARQWVAVNRDAPDDFECFCANTVRRLRALAPLAPLLAQRQWVLWRWEIPDGKRKLTKVPYQAKNPNSPARSNDSSTWDFFDAVLSSVHRASGIGFMLSEGSICAFDLDKCRDPATGALAVWARQLLEECMSYAEITPSGTGLRIIGYGRGEKVHQNIKLKEKLPGLSEAGSLEIYRNPERYITVTGDVLPGYDLELVNIDAAIDRHKRVGKAKDTQAPGPRADDAPKANGAPHPCLAGNGSSHFSSDTFSDGYTVELLCWLLSGEISPDGAEVRAPGPGHRAHDRSMTVAPAPEHPDGYIIHSFGRSSFEECRDYVGGVTSDYLAASIAELCGREPQSIEDFAAGIAPPGSATSFVEAQAKAVERSELAQIETARNRWKHARSWLAAPAIDYLASRGLIVPQDMLGHVVKFQPDGRWYNRDGKWRDPNGYAYDDAPLLIFAGRHVRTDEGRCVQAIRLPHLGPGPSRKIHGPAKFAAIKLTPHEDILAAGELCVGEGFESCLAAMMLGRENVWSVFNANGIADLLVIEGVRKLTILGEHDIANEAARIKCATRWHRAGREVVIALPDYGNDFADELIGVKAGECRG
jgi:Toprim domain